MWLYFCAAVFLLGAEVVAAISGTPSRDNSDADVQKPGAGGPTQGL
jgi:membrane protein